ncbi:MAG TPA: ATP-dependent DNA helicase RecG [Verrucomicrobiae bacterium]
MPDAPVLNLKSLVKDLWGVGRERAAQLHRLEIFSVEDLLFHRPRRYEDRRHFLSIFDLTLDSAATVRGQIVAMGLNTFAKGRKSVFEIVVDDGSARLHCRWWNLPYMENYFRTGDDVMIYGKPNSLKPRTMDHPETEVIEPGEEVSIHLNRIVPIYPLTEGLPQRWLRSLVWRTMEQYESLLKEPYPEAVSAGYPEFSNALHMLHFPEEREDTDIARKRLALNELIALQQEIQSRRRRLELSATAMPCSGDNRFIKPFLAKLGFKLTDGQTKVLREIRHDLGGEHPMRRLLQGDVGAGKTAVAACAALMTLESGYTVLLMAPTEILAEQHYRNFKRWFEPLDIPVEFQSGSRKTYFSHDRPCLVIGTHALVQEAFRLKMVGLVVIDEQHKFGVSQRESLVRKGEYPHLLVMTATPIPRTLGLTLYGDLDVSVIDKLPGNRGRIRTYVRTPDKLKQVLAFIMEKLGEGRQAYIVYPRVEEDDTDKDVKAVKGEFNKLALSLAPFKTGLLHGRVSSEEKDRVMTAFRDNKLQCLVATSVIEVGVDVPNATVMVIENAEQFGLAQLHQLRGRIGRGEHDSHCILLARLKTDEARQRMKVMEETTDGFRIAEADLELRGPGDLLGRAQSGLPPFKFANLVQDLPLVEEARRLATQRLNSK